MNERSSSFLSRAELLIDRLEQLLPRRLAPPDWDSSVAFRYRKTKTGGAMLVPVQQVNAIGFDGLKEVDSQKYKIQANTLQFVSGCPANNVLLTGARGTGKSSLVKACLSEYHRQGLRLIELDKDDLLDLPDIADLLANRPEKFIVFCDDLSFDDGESEYKALKSTLDGSISATSSNVLVYATSNRRHLLPDYHQDNMAYRRGGDGEVHPGEAVEEKMSLSDRFGLWISFYPFNQGEYLSIVGEWLEAFGVGREMDQHLRAEALRWALERGSRSGRVAWQFARDFAGRRGIGLSV